MYQWGPPYWALKTLPTLLLLFSFTASLYLCNAPYGIRICVDVRHENANRASVYSMLNRAGVFLLTPHEATNWFRFVAIALAWRERVQVCASNWGNMWAFETRFRAARRERGFEGTRNKYDANTLAEQCTNLYMSRATSGGQPSNDEKFFGANICVLYISMAFFSGSVYSVWSSTQFRKKCSRLL